ncbi:hypothetical protein [Moraxella oblonga]|uniref:hypothetical protein n=1 Tax=Moraxella oblonga TaxID=200413 RepID=UPI00082E2632|nr:hypothetical protein [Moraxella oblonga]
MITQNLSLDFKVTGQDAYWLLEFCQKNNTEPQAIFDRLLRNFQAQNPSSPVKTEKPKRRQAGALAHLNIHTDDNFWFEPMSEEELAWWNGDKTDKYGISL